MKCYKCLHYYAKFVGECGNGYNPFPCCHLREDTGEWPNPLTQECFTKRKKLKRKDDTK